MTSAETLLADAYLEQPMTLDVELNTDQSVVGTLSYSIIHCPDGRRTLKMDHLNFNLKLQSFEELVLLVHNLMDYQVRYAAIYGQTEFKHRGGLVMDRPSNPDFPIFIGYTDDSKHNVNIEDHHKCLSLQTAIRVSLVGDQWGLAMVQILRKVMAGACSTDQVRLVNLKHKDQYVLCQGRCGPLLT